MTSSTSSLPSPASSPPRRGFTLIELLIVLGILGALATLLLSNYAVDRKETLDSSIVQKELADIQRAFQRMSADCVLQDPDYETIARYGTSVLLATGLMSDWDAERGRGWRGPYMEKEGYRDIDLNSIGQQLGSESLPVLTTPFSTSDTDASYYRVVATEKVDLGGGTWAEEVIDPDDPGATIYQLWVLSPDAGTIPEAGDDIEAFASGFRRRLLLDRD